MNVIPQDEQLLAAIKAGDDVTWRKIYKQCYPVIQYLVITNSGDNDEAADVFQEALILLHEHTQRENFTLNCTVKTYLYSLSRRIWLKRLQKKGRFNTKIIDWQEFILIENTEDEVNPFESENRYDAMQQGIDKLGEPCKTILKDFYIEKMNMQEIADKMGYTNADNAKNQKYKCLNRLKKIVETLMKNE